MHIHFIGAGGIGVSALAKYYLKAGQKVSGSDLVSSEITDVLKKIGARIFIGKQKAQNLSKNTELVIYSPAVRPDNLEFKEAKRRGLKIQSYPEALGELTKNHFTIAISGTHGKSTTTAMLGLLLEKAGFDPTVVVGTKVKQFGNDSVGSPQGSNYRPGKSKYLVIEACEHEESFLNYWPKIEVITNIEADHLDYYKTLNNVIRGFDRFVGHLSKNGILIINKDDKNSKKIIKKKNQRTLLFSIKQPEANKLRKILKVPGEHNVYNALAALMVAQSLKIPDNVSFKALSEYTGSWRRFDEKQIRIKNRKIILISDYGHHPTEIKATIAAAKEKYKKEKIWCVFQPHQYQRTYYLFNEFVKTFRKNKLDKIIITDIYDVAGREDMKIRKKVSSEKLAEKVNKSNVEYVPERKLLAFLKNNAKNY
ncbi:MAG: Mur ligase family protein, partial [Patescibacteria group bacterium]